MWVPTGLCGAAYPLSLMDRLLKRGVAQVVAALLVSVQDPREAPLLPGSHQLLLPSVRVLHDLPVEEDDRAEGLTLR